MRESQMTIQRFFYLGLILFIAFTVACATTENEKKKKKEAEVTRDLGEAYLRDGKFTQALKELLKAEKLNPNDHFLQNDLGLAYYYKEIYDKAIQHYRKALDLKNDYAPAMNNLGNVYAAQRDWELAIDYYVKAAESALYATPHYPLSNLGDVYYQKKDYKRSEDYYLQALDMKPDFARALRGLARTYVALNRIEEAIAKLEKAIKIAPNYGPLHYDLAKAYQLSGNTDKARQAYETVIELAPDSPLADEAKLAIKQLR